MKSRQSGFTLVEIAIVMVIIGLLIGGILRGQALIDNAKIKSVINDMNGVAAAYYGYLDRKKVAPNPEADYIVADGTVVGNKFWWQVRSEGLLTGDPLSVSPATNAMNGYIGVINSLGVTGLAGDLVCTSVLAKYAQGIDAGLDDGLATNGSVRGYASLPASGYGPIVNENLATPVALPLTVAYGTTGYVVLCRQL